MNALRFLQRLGAINLPESILVGLDDAPYSQITWEGKDPLTSQDAFDLPISPQAEKDQAEVADAKKRLRRTTKEIIDQAIEDNRRWENLAYSFLILLLLFGVVGMVWFFIDKRPHSSYMPFVELVGPSLAFLLFKLTSSARRENIALRLLKVSLSETNNSRESAEQVMNFVKASVGILKAEQKSKL